MERCIPGACGSALTEVMSIESTISIFKLLLSPTDCCTCQQRERGWREGLEGLQAQQRKEENMHHCEYGGQENHSRMISLLYLRTRIYSEIFTFPSRIDLTTCIVD